MILFFVLAHLSKQVINNHVMANTDDGTRVLIKNVAKTKQIARASVVCGARYRCVRPTFSLPFSPTLSLPPLSPSLHHPLSSSPSPLFFSPAPFSLTPALSSCLLFPSSPLFSLSPLTYMWRRSCAGQAVFLPFVYTKFQGNKD